MALTLMQFLEKWDHAISKEYGPAFKDGMKADLEEMILEAKHSVMDVYPGAIVAKEDGRDEN